MCFLNTHMRWFSPHKTRVEPCFEGSNRFEDGMQWFKLGGSSWLSQPKHPLDLGSEQNLTKRSMDLIHFPGDFRCFFFNLNPSSLGGEGHNILRFNNAGKITMFFPNELNWAFEGGHSFPDAFLQAISILYILCFPPPVPGLTSTFSD